MTNEIPYASRRPEGGWTIRVKVVPGASRDEVVGVLGDALKVRVAAPPEQGRANASVAAALGKALAVDQKSITLAAGATSARKSFVLLAEPARWPHV